MFTKVNAILFLPCVAALAVDVQAQSPSTVPVKPQLNQFVLYAERSIKMGHRSHAEGDVGVRTAVLGAQDVTAQLRLEEHARCGNAFSPSIALEEDAEVQRVWTDTLKRVKDTEVGSEGKFPDTDMPPLPLAIAAGIGADVTIAEHHKQPLTPGVYGVVTLHEGSILHLVPGKYTFASLKMGGDSQLLGDRGDRNAKSSGVDLRIVNNL